jgi:hypothetical protein
MAMVNQKTGVRQGNANYVLYPLAAQPGARCTSNAAAVTNPNCIFYDIVVGNNSVACVAGSPNCSNQSSSGYGIMVSPADNSTPAWTTTPGYDLATGLGSVNAANLVNNWTSVSFQLALSSTSLTFGSQNVGSPSAPQTVTVTNTGTGDLTISTVTLGGTNASDFAKSADTCSGATLIPNGACTVSVTFTPSATGSRTATLSINDNAANSPQTVGLSGTGTAVRLSGTSLGFGPQPVDATSAPKTVTLTNLGNTPLRIESLTLRGTDARDFAIQSSSTCAVGSTVAGEGRCTINLAFKPTAAGARSAALVIRDSDPSSPQTVALSGMGVRAFRPLR